jgi:hypothetical protein
LTQELGHNRTSMSRYYYRKWQSLVLTYSCFVSTYRGLKHKW